MRYGIVAFPYTVSKPPNTAATLWWWDYDFSDGGMSVYRMLRVPYCILRYWQQYRRVRAMIVAAWAAFWR